MSADPINKKPLIAVAGASGFVGTHLRQYLERAYNFRALTRSVSIAELNHDASSATDWAVCDLYSLPKVTDALEGCDYGFYLVHSMAPSSRLMQANFEDTDLLLADNFIRAAEAAGLKHVIYLSGLLPDSVDDAALSPHLRSRSEVESVLRSRSVKVTVLRAGLICGPGGSSFSMLVNLVRRLPLMIMPKWARSRTQSIDIYNVCQAFELCLKDAELSGRIYDLGGHRAMTYRDLILRTAELMGRRIRVIDFPWNCFRLTKHWVSVFGSVPKALVGPLQESLQYDLEARENALLDRLRADFVSFEQSYRRAVSGSGEPKPNPRRSTQRADQKLIKELKLVRSVQRMPLPTGCDSQWVASEYGRWLTQRFAGLLDVRCDDCGVLSFVGFRFLKLLELTPTPYTVNNLRRSAFYISGGLLARRVDPPGRFEFRLFPENGCLIASIHGFAPTLPWWFYARTQAVIHLWVMRAFARHLGRL